MGENSNGSAWGNENGGPVALPVYSSVRQKAKPQLFVCFEKYGF